jgi:hypothetical protein
MLSLCFGQTKLITRLIFSFRELFGMLAVNFGVRAHPFNAFNEHAVALHAEAAESQEGMHEKAIE